MKEILRMEKTNEENKREDQKRTVEKNRLKENIKKIQKKEKTMERWEICHWIPEYIKKI